MAGSMRARYVRTNASSKAAPATISQVPLGSRFSPGPALRTHAQLRATCGVLWRVWSDGVVPLRVELVALDVEARHLLVANLDPLRIAPRVQHAVTQSTVSPLVVVVAAIRSTTAAWLMSGRPRQFWVMWQNKQCSILFHFEVPGG